MIGDRPQLRIGDHGLIGDCRSAALVARDGTIDWLCWPRFDSAALFASILDPAAGSWRIGPAGACEVGRAYLGGAAAPQARFRPAGGAVGSVYFIAAPRRPR